MLRLQGVHADPSATKRRFCLIMTLFDSGDQNMLYAAIALFLIAILAAIFGFGGIAASIAGLAKIAFFVFLVLAIVSLVFGLVRRSK